MRLPQQLGPYIIEKRIGIGAMGEVYRGYHQMLSRHVAVKLRFRTRNSREPILAERFRQGALLQGSVDHPSLARVYDYLETQNSQALVMEFFAGGSAEEKLRAGPLSVADALEVALRVAEGLHAAHERGVVHRDIKPDNMMFRSLDPCSVALVDFGVAKAVERGLDLTTHGAHVGTVWYMSPEQFNREPPHPLMDVYALGATLYELLSGQIPFESKENSAIFSRFLDGIPPPPLQKLNPQIPPTLIAVVEAALCLEPERRIPSAAAFAFLLRSVGRRAGFSLLEPQLRPIYTQDNMEQLHNFMVHLRDFEGAEVQRAVSDLQVQLRRAHLRSGDSDLGAIELLVDFDEEASSFSDMEGEQTLEATLITDDFENLE